jgi:hypothetical protein
MIEKPEIEVIKDVYLKSALSQIFEAFVKLQQLGITIDDIYTQLNKKVNLVSDMLDGETTAKILGPGTVTASSTNVVGTNTFFKRYMMPGNQIQIGSEISTIDVITDDTHMTVMTPFVSSYTDVIYSIIRDATREELMGDFNFGQLNGEQFRGVIQEGSYLEHYGRIATPNDVVNVRYVQKSVGPAIVLAQNAIKRSGDTVGAVPISGTLPTAFNFINCDFLFDEHCTLRFKGVVSELDLTQVATVKYVNDMIQTHVDTYIAQLFYAQWVCDNCQSLSGAGGLWRPLSVTPFTHNTNGSQYNEYFTIGTYGLTCIKACSILLTMDTFQDSYHNNSQNEGSLLVGNITQNAIQLSAGQSFMEASNTIGSEHKPAFSCSAIIECSIGDVIACGVVGNRPGAIHAYTSLTRLR